MFRPWICVNWQMIKIIELSLNNIYPVQADAIIHGNMLSPISLSELEEAAS